MLNRSNSCRLTVFWRNFLVNLPRWGTWRERIFRLKDSSLYRFTFLYNSAPAPLLKRPEATPKSGPFVTGVIEEERWLVLNTVRVLPPFKCASKIHAFPERLDPAWKTSLPVYSRKPRSSRSSTGTAPCWAAAPLRPPGRRTTVPTTCASDHLSHSVSTQSGAKNPCAAR